MAKTSGGGRRKKKSAKAIRAKRRKNPDLAAQLVAGIIKSRLKR